MGTMELFKLLRAKGIVSRQVDMEALFKSHGVTLSNGFVTYSQFVALFAKTVLYAALGNVCHLLLMGRMKFSLLSLPLNISGYQRGIYISGVKNYKHLQKDMRDVLKTTQELTMKEDGYTDPYEYFYTTTLVESFDKWRSTILLKKWNPPWLTSVLPIFPTEGIMALLMMRILRLKKRP